MPITPEQATKLNSHEETIIQEAFRQIDEMLMGGRRHFNLSRFSSSYASGISPERWINLIKPKIKDAYLKHWRIKEDTPQIGGAFWVFEDRLKAETHERASV
jgi:hypothetical protein